MNKNAKIIKIHERILIILKHLHDDELEEALPVAIELTKNLVDGTCPEHKPGLFMVPLTAKALLEELSSTINSLLTEIDELHDHIEGLEIQLSRVRRQKQSGERNGN